MCFFCDAYIDYLLLLRNNRAMNTLERFRTEKGLSFSQLSKQAGLSRSMVWKHCNQKCQMTHEKAMQYEATLGIPRHLLRPDIWSISEATHAPQA